MKTLIAACLRKAATLAGNRQGNFAIMFVLLVPVLLTAAGASIDLATIMNAKTRLRSVTDAAAMAASAALADKKVTVDGAKTLAIAYVDAQLGTKIGQNGNTSAQFADIEIDDTPNPDGTHTYDVALNVGYNVPLSGLNLLIQDGNRVVNAESSTSSTSEGAVKAVSVFLALDRSMSMKYDVDDPSISGGPNSKMNALKAAVSHLADILHDADPTAGFVRTGAVSYNWFTDTPSDVAWGESGIRTYVDALVPDGDTNTSGPMQTAKEELDKTKENQAHKDRNGQTPTRFIVLMTDGVNSALNFYTDLVYDSAGQPVLDSTGHFLTVATAKTEATCDEEKADGVIIYTIGFAAPAEGKPLLQYCATDTDHYFDAQSADDLYKAFEEIGHVASGKIARLTN